MADVPGFSDFPQRAISKFLRRVDGRMNITINSDADRRIIQMLHESDPSLFHPQSQGAQALKNGGELPDGTKIKLSNNGKRWLRDARVESHVAADAALEDLKKRVDAGEVQNVAAQQEREAIERMRGDYDPNAEMGAQGKANRRAERAADNPFRDTADDNPFAEEETGRKRSNFDKNRDSIRRQSDVGRNTESVNDPFINDGPEKLDLNDEYLKGGDNQYPYRSVDEVLADETLTPTQQNAEIRSIQARQREAAREIPTGGRRPNGTSETVRSLNTPEGELPNPNPKSRFAEYEGETPDRPRNLDNVTADEISPGDRNPNPSGEPKTYEQPAPTTPERPRLERGSPAHRARFPEQYPDVVEVPRAEYDEMMRLRNRTGLSVAENAAGDPFVTRPTAPAPEPRTLPERLRTPVETAAGDPYLEIPFEERGRLINEGWLQTSRVPKPLPPDPTSSPIYRPEIYPEGTLAEIEARQEAARVAANDARLREIGGADVPDRPARPAAEPAAVIDDNPFGEVAAPEASLTSPASAGMVDDLAELTSLDDFINTLPHGVRTEFDSRGLFDAVANGEARAADVIYDAYKSGLVTADDIQNINNNDLLEKVATAVEDDIMANPPKARFPEEILPDVEAAKVEGAPAVEAPQGAAVEAAPSLGEEVLTKPVDGSGFLYDIGTNGKQKMVKPSKDMIGREVRTIHDRFTNSAGETGIHEGVIQAVDARGNVSVLHADGTTGIYPRSGLGVLDAPPVAQKLAEPMPTRASVQAPVAETPVTINRTVPTGTTPVVENPFVEVPAATPTPTVPETPNPFQTPVPERPPLYTPPDAVPPGWKPPTPPVPETPVTIRPTVPETPVTITPRTPVPGGGGPFDPRTVLPENVVRAAESNARIKMGPGARTALQKYKSGAPMLPEEIDAITGGAHALDPLKGGAAKLTGMAGEEAATGLARLGLKGGARAIGSDFLAGAMGPVGLAGMIGGQAANFVGGQLDKPETVDTRGLDRSDVGQFLKGAGGTASWAAPLAAGAIAATGGAAAIPIGLAAGALTLGTGIKNAVFDKKVTPEDRLRRTYKALQGSRMALSSKDFADVMSTYRSSIEQGVKPEEAAALAQQTLSSLSQTNLQRNMTPNTRPTAGQLLALQSKYQQQVADSEARNNQYLDAALGQTNRVAQDAGPMSGLLQSQAMQLRSAISNSNEANRNYAMLAPYYEGFAQQQKDLNSQYDKLTGATQLSGLNTLDPQAMLAAAKQASTQSGLGG